MSEYFLYREGWTVRMYLAKSPVVWEDMLIQGPFSISRKAKITVFIIPVNTGVPVANKKYKASSFKGNGPFSETGAKKYTKENGWVLAAKSLGGDHYLKAVKVIY